MRTPIIAASVDQMPCLAWWFANGAAREWALCCAGRSNDE